MAVRETPPLLRSVVLNKPNVPNSVKTLRASYRRKLVLPNTGNLISELLAESDRAAVILAASLLDDLTANAIALKMVGHVMVDDMEQIFRADGPLGSFSARLEVGNLFGAIDNDTYLQLATLREMRNACAHSKHKIGFDDDVLRNVALRFFTGFIAPEFAQKHLKEAFGLEVGFLAMALSHGRAEGFRLCREEHMTAAARHASRDRPTPP